MKQLQIQQYICTRPVWHGWCNGKGLSHFQAGETKCRKCDLYFKKEYLANLCPICHNMLAHKSKSRK